MKKLAKHYTSLQLEFKDGAQEQQQLLALEDQKLTITDRCKKLDNEKCRLEAIIYDHNQTLQELRLKQQEADRTLKELDESNDFSDAK